MKSLILIQFYEFYRNGYISVSNEPAVRLVTEMRNAFHIKKICAFISTNQLNKQEIFKERFIRNSSALLCSGRRIMGKADIAHKSFFENAEWFADLMNAAFFGGEEILDAKELLPEDGAVQKADKGAVMERLRDVVKKHTKDGSTFALYVLENQAIVDYTMLIRIMVEESLTYDRQVKEIRKRNKEAYGNILKGDEFICGFRRNDRLAPVFTLVLYWGDKEWDAVTSLQDMVSVPAADYNHACRIRDIIPNYRIQVFDLNKVNDFSCFKTTLRTVFEFYSNRKSTEKLKEYLSSHEPEVRGLDEESRFLLATMIKEKRLKKQFLKKAEPKEKEVDDMCEAIQGMIDEGKEEGRITILKKLVETKDISIEIAARTLGTTVEEIEIMFSKI